MTDLATRDSNRLIASDRVEGTTVYNRQGEKLGSISRFMVDKRSGKVDYAVLSFGGLFGMGSDQYPLPWNVLDYDPQQGGYVVDLDRKVLEEAPRHTAEQTPDYDDAYGRTVFGYYGVPYPY